MPVKQLVFVFFIIAFLSDLEAQTRDGVNYDESKVPVYTLPDVLKTSTGEIVDNKMLWEKVRRPEILTLFEDNIYGQMPKSYDSISYAVVSENKHAMDNKAHLKEVLIEVFHNHQSVKINLVLFVPINAKAPVPVFLLINNRGKENTDPTRNKKSEFWPAEMVIDSGYAAAAIHVSDLAPDDKDDYVNGALRLYPDQLVIDNGMRAIGAWAWGASRVMDYFEQDGAINAKQVVLVGHSRGGKASLWAAAQDKRFAICVSNCSGHAGAALTKRQFGESIKNLNTRFPHWFNTKFKEFNDKDNLIPVDQHMLISLIAPRPVYVTNASKDLWADPKGTFLSLKHAEPVYSLYKIKSNLPDNPPKLNVPFIQSRLGYHNREGKHDLTVYDWTNFIKFANYNFNAN